LIHIPAYFTSVLDILRARSKILKGVTLGDRVIIGAGSVVTKDVPAYSIAAGNPARIVGAIPNTNLQ
jgi:acetyltransferase-like isoleucine patch superfamily enzyme